MPKKRITWSWAIIIIVIAVSIDIEQAIVEWVTGGISDIFDALVMDPLVLVFFWFIFYFFLKVNFTRTRALVFFGMALLEFIPVVKDFPLWTADVIAVMMMVAAEDRIGWLKKLDASVKTNKVGFGSKITNVEELRKMTDPAQLKSLRGVSGAIMGGAAITNRLARGPKTPFNKRSQDARQGFDNQIGAYKDNRSREEKLNAQRANNKKIQGETNEEPRS
jgi:hypothetical protein